MIMKKDLGFLLPTLAEESGTPVPGEKDVGSSSTVSSPSSQGIAAVMNALRPSKTPAPGNLPRAFSRTASRAASRAATAMSLARPLT